MTEQFLFSYILKKKNYRYLKKALIPSYKSSQLTILFFLSVFLNVVTMLRDPLGSVYWDFIVFAVLMALSIICYVFYKKSVCIGYRKYTKKHLDTVPFVSISFGDIISFSSGNKISEYSYSQISDVYESEDAFYVKVSDDMLFLPKTALSGGDVMDFRLFIMPKQHYVTTKPHENRTAVLPIILALISILCYGILLHGTTRQTDATPFMPGIVSRHYSDNYSIIYQHEIQDGTIAFLYDSRHNNIAYCIYDQKKIFNHFERGLQYNLTEVANYNEYKRQLFWCEPITYDGNTLIYGWIDADSSLKNLLEHDGISSVHFVTEDNEYILYFMYKEGE